MAARKPVEEVNETAGFGPLTTVVTPVDTSYKGPTVPVFLPALEDSGSAGLKVDQYEHVTIQNEVMDKTWYIHRGESVEVPVDVYMVLKQKYPNI